MTASEDALTHWSTGNAPQYAVGDGHEWLRNRAAGRSLVERFPT